MLPLGENVPVGAAVLHGNAVATVWCVAAHGVEGAILIVVSNVLQHRRVPHKAKVTVLHLRGGRMGYSERGIFVSGQLSSFRLETFSGRSLTGFQIASGGFFSPLNYANKHK